MKRSPKIMTGFCGAIAALLWALPVSAETPEPQRQTLEAPNPERILFIGNSYFYYNDSLHNHVVRMAREGVAEIADALVYKSATIGGASLEQHPVAQHLEPGRLNVDEPFDLVILQGGSAEPLSDERRRRFREMAMQHAKTVRAAGAEVALYMTHAYVEPHRRASETMIDTVSEAYLSVGNEIDALVIPVGLAFDEAYRQRPDIELHKPFDGSHPSLLGTYLAASVVFATLYEKPASGLEYNYFDAVSDDDAAFLQGIADETVADFFRR